MNEQQIEQELIGKLADLKYRYRQDVHDRATLEKNFRVKFEALNRSHLPGLYLMTNNPRTMEESHVTQLRSHL